ncbi:hypothetical protein GCM10010885_23840 [Alicyclobacillus cellulosilyticus]|uniref:Big-1 domain-containing protein n=1 Tax=Alicyclobacillus cellulosilyticus TaxID=1003997 RepID=A0A917KIK2_9BACL|nr:hypothetical protein [Alicyclobacillus cellulosilyticus]GGJ13726.1 hypothetical protein GCM10010885_23840 [Alicyclobacillus cellulosilyticus]
MKRTLTGITAASLVLGTMVPMAMAAAPKTTPGVSYNQRSLTIGSYYSASFKGVAAKDGQVTTEFLPLYYLQQGLKKLGYTVKWNGTAKTLNIIPPSTVRPDLTNINAGHGTVAIQINGTTVQYAPEVVAKDPASGVATAYVPIYYLNKVLQRLGFTTSYNGSVWSLTPSVQNVVPKISNIQVTGASSGDGSATSPAVVVNGGTLTLSVTLTDVAGNPLPGTQVTFQFTPTGASSAGALVVTQNGQQLPNNGSGAFAAYTDAQGKATITVQDSSGQLDAFTVKAQAPYQLNNTTISTPAAYVEFVPSNAAGIAPYNPSSAQPYAANFGASVPVTVAVPQVNGVPQANVAVQFTVNGGSAYFTNSSGAYLGQTVTAYTNSQGVATVWVADANAEEVAVTATVNSAYTNWSATTYIQWGQLGTATQISGLSVTNQNPLAGTNVTISGTVVDAAGNPVPNAQLLLWADKGSYVVGTTTTSFPSVSISQGVPATSAYGEVITANANGYFSAVVTDSSAETATYRLYPVANGVVSQSSPIATMTISWQPSNTLAHITTYTFKNDSPGSGDATSGSGVVAQYGQPSANVYFAPVSSTGALKSGTFTYNLSVSNGGNIYAIDDVPLANPVSATTLTVNATTDASGNTQSATISVPGGFTFGGTTYNSVTLTNGGTIHVTSGTLYAPAPTWSDAEEFAVSIKNGSNIGNTVLTVSNGSISATQTINVIGGAPAKIANVTPVSTTLLDGQSTTLQFTVEDSNGNPVPNTSVALQLQADAPSLWITQVNGQTLQQSEVLQSGGNALGTAVEPTPIPLFYFTGLGYNSVTLPGVVSASKVGNGDGSQTSNQPQVLHVFTDAQGKVTLTIQNDDVSYFDSSKSRVSAYTTTNSGILNIGYGTTTDANGNTVLQYVELSSNSVDNPQAKINY